MLCKLHVGEVVAESYSKSLPSPCHVPARLTIRSAPQPALKAGMPGWVFAGSIRVRGGLEPLMACTDTSCPGAALAMRASRPEKSHPGVTAGACSGNTAVVPSGNSRSFFWQQPELPRITLVQSFGEHGDGYAKDMRWTLARLRSGWRIKAVRAEQTTSGCFEVRRPDRQLTTMEGLYPLSYAKRPTCLKSPKSPY